MFALMESPINSTCCLDDGEDVPTGVDVCVLAATLGLSSNLSLAEDLESHSLQDGPQSGTIATTQPTTQNNLKQLLLGWYYYR
jgi:hypothetical protein